MSRPVPFARTWSLLLLLGAPALGQEGASPSADDAPAPEEVERAGEVFRASCLGCHRVPDPRFELDRAWLGQVQDTAWSDTPARARAALQVWLARPELERANVPAPVDAGAAAPDGSGRVRLALGGAGVLVLRDAEGDLHRIGREPGAPGAAPPEAGPLAFDLPLGTYRVVSQGRRFEVPAGDAAPPEVWWLSSSDPLGAEVEVRADAVLELAPVAGVELRAGLRRGQVNAEVRAAGATGAKDEEGAAPGAGTTLYRDGRRVPIAWTVEDAEGAVHARGDLRYGWGGGGWAPVGSLSESARARDLRVRLRVDGRAPADLPFPARERGL